ncbi:MAG: lambda exonuclease family protein [Parcubacteria group bacterium]
MEQGSAEWFAARCGKVTASRVADVVARTKTGWGASRANYAAELIAERLTGATAPSFTNAAMQHGTLCEPLARQNYQDRHGVLVTEIAFVEHPEIAMSGASPDGLVGDAGLIEIKCPNTATHLDTLLGEPIAQKYVTQMQWQMAVTGRSWCDFCSFDPRLPEHLQLYVQRVPRDVGLILELEHQVTDFLSEIDTKLAALAERFGNPLGVAA